MNTYDTATLAGVVRELDQFDPFLLAMFFPEIITFETSTIDFDVVNDSMQLAPFVSPMVAGKANKAEGGEVRKFKPAYVKPKHIVDPERMLKRRPGESIGGTLSGPQRRDAIIADLLDVQRKQIRRRSEWMAAQALLTGKVTVSGEDYPEVEVDFQRAAGLTITLAGADAWDQLSTATPLDDIDDWAALMEGPITKLVFAPTAWALFRKFQSVKDMLDTRRGSDSRLETGPDGSKWFSYKGMIGANIECWVYSGFYKNAAGTKVNIMPDNTVIGGSDAVEGVRGYGAILDGTAGYMAMEEYPKNWQQDDPAVEYVMTQSAPLMIPSRPNASVAVTVK